ncbi:MAG: ExbD/TolR family protein [Verrucomicrobiales bacterium]
MKLETHLALTPRFLHVVPFLGVVILLLSFFLLGSSMVMQSGIRVQPPASSSLLEPMPHAHVITITSGREPQIYWNDRPVTLGELERVLNAEREKSRPVVLVRADELAAYGSVAKVSQLALKSGYDVVQATMPELGASVSP